MENNQYKDVMIADIVRRYQRNPDNATCPIHYFKQEDLNWDEDLVDKNGKSIPTITGNYQQFVANYQQLMDHILAGLDVSDEEKLALLRNDRFITHDLLHFPNYDEDFNIEDDLTDWNHLFNPILNTRSVNSGLLTNDKLKQIKRFADKGYQVLKKQTSNYRPNTVIIDLPLSSIKGGHYYCTLEDNSWDAQEVLSEYDLEKMADQTSFTLADFVSCFSIIWNSSLISENDRYIAFNSGDLMSKSIYDKTTGYYAETTSLDYSLKANLNGIASGLDFNLKINELE